MELIEFDIIYLPRPSIKDQAVANYVVECTIYMEDKLKTNR